MTVVEAGTGLTRKTLTNDNGNYVASDSHGRGGEQR
jgi:hypothetical protein